MHIFCLFVSQSLCQSDCQVDCIVYMRVRLFVFLFLCIRLLVCLCVLLWGVCMCTCVRGRVCLCVFVCACAQARAFMCMDRQACTVVFPPEFLSGLPAIQTHTQTHIPIFPLFGYISLNLHFSVQILYSAYVYYLSCHQIIFFFVFPQLRLIVDANFLLTDNDFVFEIPKFVIPVVCGASMSNFSFTFKRSQIDSNHSCLLLLHSSAYVFALLTHASCMTAPTKDIQ